MCRNIQSLGDEWETREREMSNGSPAVRPSSASQHPGRGACEKQVGDADEIHGTEARPINEYRSPSSASQYPLPLTFDNQVGDKC